MLIASCVFYHYPNKTSWLQGDSRPQLIGHCHLLIITCCLITVTCLLWPWCLRLNTMNALFTKSWTVKHFTYPYFSTRSAITLTRFTTCLVLHLSSHCIFFKYLLTSRLLFQNSFDKLGDKKKKRVRPTNKRFMPKIYNISRNVSPLWLVKSLCLFGDIRETSLSDERDDSDKVSVHEDRTEVSEKRKHIIFKKQCSPK